MSVLLRPIMRATEHSDAALKYLGIVPYDYEPNGAYPMVVLLHGYGTNMADLASVCPVIDRTGYVYICPNAPLPLIPGSGVGGYAWAPLPLEEIAAAEPALAQITVTVEDAIGRYGVEPGNVVIGGFSQGGMMSYLTGLPSPDVFGGVFALSSSLPDPDGLSRRLPTERTQPVFVSHGTTDAMIPVEQARQASSVLEELGYSPRYREYEMVHQVTNEVIDDLRAWLHEVLPPALPTE